jgi:hypothetical protein
MRIHDSLEIFRLINWQPKYDLIFGLQDSFWRSHTQHIIDF